MHWYPLFQLKIANLLNYACYTVQNLPASTRKVIRIRAKTSKVPSCREVIYEETWLLEPKKIADHRELLMDISHSITALRRSDV